MSNSISASTLEKFTTFGDILRFLRRRIGLTQMELAIAVGYSDTQISRLEQNLRLPDIHTIEARFVPVLGLEEEPKAAARLLDLAAHVRREDAPALGLCPYKGLNYFDEADAELFVGREALTTRLVERVFALSEQEIRFLAIVGASGSGKSSLVRAGLVSALRWNTASTDWHIHILTPSAHPLESLATTLTAGSHSMMAISSLMDDLAGDSRSLQIFARQKLGLENGQRLLLVIDQFEELFALCHSEEERSCFIGNLLTAASEPSGPVMVVLTLRADFYAHCANYPVLREAVAKNQEYIGAMNVDELRRSIEEPARRGRWEFEAGLIDLLLHEVGQEPGALPLLSHALFETWQKRHGRMMTLSGYASSGGVRGAIAETAETVFSDQFTGKQKSIARRIFLRLTELREDAGVADTRRRATFNELILKPEESALTREVLKALADARLITTSEDSAEVAHEALIREWPTLRGWLEENRESLRLHHQLAEIAQEWLILDRSPDLLYRGIRLMQTREWASAHQEEMNELECEFLDASIASSEREARLHEEQRQRELEAARKLAESERQRAETERVQVEQQIHTSRQLRKRAIYLSAVLALAVIAALTAGVFARRSAINLTRSEAQRLAAEATRLLVSHGETNLTALLAIRSLNMQYTPSADAVLANLSTLQSPPIEFKGHTEDLWGAVFSPDGKYLATGSDDRTARLWDVATGQTIRTFSGHTGPIGQVAFSPDGKYLFTASLDHTVRMWDVATAKTVQIFSGHTGGVDVVALSADGKYLVTNGAKDNTARLWDVATGKTLHVFTGHTAEVVRATIAPDGKTAVSTSLDGTTRVWDAATGSQLRILDHPFCIEAVTYSHDSQYIATPCDDGVIRIWDAATGQVIHEFSYPNRLIVPTIKFSPDDRFLLTGSEDRTARLWDIATGQVIRVFGGHRNTVQDAEFSSDGNFIATGGNDGIARVWKIESFPGGVQFTVPVGAVQASFSPDGKQIVVAIEDNTARILDIATGRTITNLKGHTGPVRGAVFSPDGRQVLTASEDGTARLWDATTGKEVRRFEGHTDCVNRAIFSPDGKYIVTTSFDGTARVWDVQTRQTIVTYTHQGPGHVNRVAFSPDGKIVATSGDHGTVHTWDPFTGRDIMNFEGHTDDVRGIAFSPDGKYLVTASIEGSVRLWEATTGKEVRRFAGHPGGATGAAFSPDGKYVVSGGVEGIARLWDVQSGQEIRRFVGGPIEIATVTFSSDGKYLLTASFDGNVRLWLVDVDETIHAICGLLTRDLTSDERIEFGISDQGPTCPAQ